MTTEIPPLPATFKDRKTGLMICGVVQILIGCFFLLSIFGVVVGQLVMAHRPGAVGQMTAAQTLSTIGMLLVFAVAAIWLGAGSMRACRWARAIGLCVAVVALIAGVLGLGSVVLGLRAFEAAMQQASQQSGQPMPPAAIAIAQAAMIGFSVIFYVLLPGAFVLFYRRHDVKLTCETRDPVPRWTDRCPLPVLGVVLLQAFGAVCLLLFLPTYGRVFSVLGHLVSGPFAWLAYSVFPLVSLYAARGYYRLDCTAYWVYLVVVVIGGVNSVVSFSGGRLMRLYEALGFPPAQLDHLRQSPFVTSPLMIWFPAAALVVMIAYLGWLKRFFGSGPEAQQADESKG